MRKGLNVYRTRTVIPGASCAEFLAFMTDENIMTDEIIMIGKFIKKENQEMFETLPKCVQVTLLDSLEE